jgi:hypothetical protein
LPEFVIALPVGLSDSVAAEIGGFDEMPLRAVDSAMNTRAAMPVHSYVDRVSMRSIKERLRFSFEESIYPIESGGLGQTVFGLGESSQVIVFEELEDNSSSTLFDDFAQPRFINDCLPGVSDR